MEDDIFIKKMKGVKPLKNGKNYIEPTNIKKNKKILKTPTNRIQKDETIKTKKQNNQFTKLPLVKLIKI